MTKHHISIVPNENDEFACTHDTAYLNQMLNIAVSMEAANSLVAVAATGLL